MKYILILLAFIFYSSCSYHQGRLVSRGMSEKDRRFFIVHNGGNLSWEIKKNFIKGVPCKGMYVDMIFYMYGEPNFKGVTKRDSITNNIIEYQWIYYMQDKENKRNLKIVLEVMFDEVHMVKYVLGKECEILANCPKI